MAPGQSLTDASSHCPTLLGLGSWAPRPVRVDPIGAESTTPTEIDCMRARTGANYEDCGFDGTVLSRRVTVRKPLPTDWRHPFGAVWLVDVASIHHVAILAPRHVGRELCRPEARCTADGSRLTQIGQDELDAMLLEDQAGTGSTVPARSPPALMWRSPPRHALTSLPPSTYWYTVPAASDEPWPWPAGCCGRFI